MENVVNIANSLPTGGLLFLRLSTLELAFSCDLRLRELAFSCSLRLRELAFSCDLRLRELAFSCSLRLRELAFSCSLRLRELYILYPKDVMQKDGVWHLPLYMAMFL